MVLLGLFKENQADVGLLKTISEKETALSSAISGYRPLLEGNPLLEGDLETILTSETNVEKRKKAWESSKEIGKTFAQQTLELVRLRNELAKSQGYPDYFSMKLDIDEVDQKELETTFMKLAETSENAYQKVIRDIQAYQTNRYNVSPNELGPWAWSEPFGQADPIAKADLDGLVKDVDIVAVSVNFYKKMGIDVGDIINRSDLFPKEGKKDDGYCVDIDRAGDIRIFNTLTETIQSLDYSLHELGHAVYNASINPNLPWLLRERPHITPTEAFALLMGRQAYNKKVLPSLVGDSDEKKSAIELAEKSYVRKQLIFSRWVLVMTFFEQGLYKNPDQDLNKLWWDLVEKYQRIPRPQGREGAADWAAKDHIRSAPVYYYSYLYGEMLASSLQEAIVSATGSDEIQTVEAGKFLKEKMFYPGSSFSWPDLVQNVTGRSLNPDAWVSEFSKGI